MRHALSLILRVGTVALLALALLNPTLPLAGRDIDVVFVVDASASMAGGGRDAALDWVAQAQAARGDDDRAGLVLFGRDAQVGYRLTALPPNGLPPVVVLDDATNLERAVRLAGGLLGEARRRRVVLLTDGRATEGNIGQAAARLADDGIGLDVVTIGDGAVADVLVEGVTVPSSVREGEAYDIAVDLRNDSGQDARGQLVTMVDGQEVDSRTVDLPPGASQVRVSHTAGPGGLERVQVELLSGDSTVTRNDTGAGAVRVAGPARVLVVSDPVAPDVEVAPLAAALEATGVGVVRRTAVPAVDELLTYDAVVLVNVRAPALGDRGMGALDVAVRDGGVGLVAVGGSQAFGLGDYEDTVLEDLLPVTSRITDPLRRPKVAEALVVDSSESMGACHCSDNQAGPIAEDPGAVDKTEIARQAVRRAVQQLDASDTVGVLAFDTSSRWVLPLQQVPESAIVEDGLAQLQPSGNTDIPQAIRLAIDGLRTADADLRHIVLFTDGFMGDLSGLEPVAEEALSAGVTLSVVGTGEGSFPELQGMAETGGGRYYPGRNLAEIPDILAAEVLQVARPLVSEGEFLPTITGVDPVTNDLQTAPPLRGFVATTAKPTARRLLAVGSFDDPLLTTWQAGIGTTTAWTSDASTRWSAAWVDWEGYQRFWTTVVRGTFPDAGQDSVDVTASITAGGLRVSAAVPSDVAGTRVSATVVDVAGHRQTVDLARDAEGGFGGDLPAGSQGVHLVTVTATDGEGDSIGRAVVPAVRAYPAEFGTAAADTDRVAAAVAATGGTLDPAPLLAFRRDGLDPGRSGRQTWPWLAALALLLAVAEVGVRRLRLDRTDLTRARAWATARLSRSSSAPPAPDTRTQPLDVRPAEPMAMPEARPQSTAEAPPQSQSPPSPRPPSEPSVEPPQAEQSEPDPESATDLDALRNARDRAFRPGQRRPW